MNDESWDSGPAAGWSIGDLDGAEISRTVEEAVRRRRLSDPETREPPGMLRALGLLVDDAPRRASVVLFGRAERPMMPRCLCARIRGRSEHLDDRRFNGNVSRVRCS